MSKHKASRYAAGAGSGGPATGTKAGVVAGFQQGDTSAAAHAIANSSPEGHGASEALGQLYHDGEALTLMQIY